MQNMQLVKSLSASVDLQVADTLRLKSVKMQQLVQEEDYAQARRCSESVMHPLCLVCHPDQAFVALVQTSCMTTGSTATR